MIIKDGQTFEMSTPEEMLAYQIGAKDQYHYDNDVMKSSNKNSYGMGFGDGMTVTALVCGLLYLTIPLVVENKDRIKCWFKKTFKKKH